MDRKKTKDYYFMFGKESSGIPHDLLRGNKDKLMRIPMSFNARSLNLSNCAAIVMFLASEQLHDDSILGDEPDTFKGKNFIDEIDVNNLTAANIIYENNVTVKAKLDALNDAVDSIESVVVVGITAGSGIDVDTSTSTSIPTIGIKIKEGSSITVNEDGLDIV